MKVLLVALNARYTHSNLALRYLRNEIAGAGHHAVIREFSINQNYFDIIDTITGENPDVIALSVYIWNAELMRTLIADIIKLIPEIKIIVGGPEAGYDAERWKNISGVIAVICGHGEGAMRRLAQNDFQTDEKIIARTNISFADIPFPYTEDDFAALAGKYIYYESSRGCPFSCSYCLSSREDALLEFRDPGQTCDELDRLIDHQSLVIKFVDRSFNADPKRARAIWEHLIKKKGESRFHFEIHPLLLEEADFDCLEHVPQDLFQFEIGVQSIHEKTLRAVGRTGSWEKSKENIRRLINLKNIHIHLDLIAGLPGETLSEIGESIDEIMSLNADHFQLGFLKVLPGTEIASQAEEFGIIRTEKPPYQILANRWLSRQDLTLLRRIEQLIDTTYNGSLSRSVIRDYALREGGYFSAYLAILRYAEKSGFDISTKNPSKLGELFSHL
ncbi:MAG TPA: DUF4080 domain-containing protein [Spirochaetota bacterium]